MQKKIRGCAPQPLGGLQRPQTPQLLHDGTIRRYKIPQKVNFRVDDSAGNFCLGFCVPRKWNILCHPGLNWLKMPTLEYRTWFLTFKPAHSRGHMCQLGERIQQEGYQKKLFPSSNNGTNGTNCLKNTSINFGNMTTSCMTQILTST